MNLFNRLPGFPCTPAGKERIILRLIPRAFFLGTLTLALPSLFVRLLDGPEGGLTAMSTDIYVISLVILHWTVLFTVGIAAFIVMMMKGPAYVADAYPLEELESLQRSSSGNLCSNPHGK